MGEIGHAAVRQNLTLKEANSLILKLLEKYEHVFDLPDGNPGVRFDQAYNMQTLKPIQEWQQMYEEVKREIYVMGLKTLQEL